MLIIRTPSCNLKTHWLSALGLPVVRGSSSGEAAFFGPPEAMVATVGLAMFMCKIASTISILEATGIDPAPVFKRISRRA